MNNEDIHGPVPEDTRDGSAPPMPKGKQAFQNVNRKLSDDDLTNPAVGKLLLNEKDRLEIENDELKDYQDRFYETDKKVAVVQEKNKTHLATEITSVGCIAMGGVLLGHGISEPSNWIIGCGALVFIIGIVAIFAKAVKR